MYVFQLEIDTGTKILSITVIVFYSIWGNCATRGIFSSLINHSFVSVARSVRARCLGVLIAVLRLLGVCHDFLYGDGTLPLPISQFLYLYPSSSVSL